MKQSDSDDMVDFREYLQIEEYFLKEYEDDGILNFHYDESPFKPIAIGNYTLYLCASEQSLCTPAINSLNKYMYSEWEVMVEKFHDKYGYVICTAEVMNELGFDDFEPKDHYVAYAEIDLVQKIFDNLVDKIDIPIINI